jgi:hypothetical protein
MSKLGEKIRKALRLEAAPLGFRAVAGKRTPPLLLVLRFDVADAKTAAAAVEKGADALLFRLPEGSKAEVRPVVDALDAVPCGIWKEDLDREGVAALMEEGVDYFVFSAEKTPATALLESKAGYVLALDSEAKDSYLRAVETLPLEAVMLREPEDSLTVGGQLELRRIVGLTRKPLMIPATPSLDTPEIESLRDSGVSLLLLDGNDRAVLEALPELRKKIEAVPAQPRRREERAATLPAMGQAELEEEEEEEEEE